MSQRAPVRIGAGWKKTSNIGREYLSVKLEDPSFSVLMYVSVLEVEGGDGCVQRKIIRDCLNGEGQEKTARWVQRYTALPPASYDATKTLQIAFDWEGVKPIYYRLTAPIRLRRPPPQPFSRVPES